LTSGFLVLVMVATGQDPDFVFFDFIDQAVFPIDAPGPAAGKLMFERLGFASAVERVSLNFFYQLDNAQCFFTIFFNPPGGEKMR